MKTGLNIHIKNTQGSLILDVILLEMFKEWKAWELMLIDSQTDLWIRMQSYIQR